MGQKLSPSDQALYRAVDEVLHYIWDPIGVADVPQARDEYHAYLPQVFGLLRNGSAAHVIAAYLSNICTERMGLNENASHDLRVADILLSWQVLIRSQHA